MSNKNLLGVLVLYCLVVKMAETVYNKQVVFNVQKICARLCQIKYILRGSMYLMLKQKRVLGDKINERSRDCVGC